ncbi:hypothetical protein M430DRAFT_191583 [Amorphotheca resinae ATCC 22711]|uniref:Uncharacterized protein n=1 Tax=Amorphotheca resinae ATCC 22711 TaxID=857342 RepID=A0A2T3APT7_AMORE|nr:hypothetical protein M430DRAFT_191583 [Amorphotheca resinae ATCC 22711]PSS07020.1 hypothetical protein M430DRAFT_191583 [Amorphotheca resinae ATCC 22711]
MRSNFWSSPNTHARPLLYFYFSSLPSLHILLSPYHILFYSILFPTPSRHSLLLRKTIARTGATKTYDSSLFLSFFYYANMCYPGYSGVILIVYAFI